MVYKLYDVSNRFKIIDTILRNISDPDVCFDLKLILCEAILNANEHGHQFNNQKAITITANLGDSYYEFIIEDEDPLIKNYHLSKQVHNDDILNESGRGLFLIQQLSDYVALEDNKLIIRKEVFHIAK